MTDRRNRAGFTLVELLVVIVIIGMLVALLMPAVMSAREAARGAKCSNNQQNLGKAILVYENAKQRFPGYVNRVGKDPSDLTKPPVAGSWVVAILKDIGRSDLAELWREGREDQSQVHLELCVCPSDMGTGSSPLSYVANCGHADETLAPRGAYGVFHNRYTPTAAQLPAFTVSLSDIRDGAQHTLLLAEQQFEGKTTDGQWTNPNRANVGFVWDTGTTIKAHISSNHPDGLFVTFCDGHGQFLRNNINYDVYQKLMTPNGSKVAVPQGPLNEGDY